MPCAIEALTRVERERAFAASSPCGVFVMNHHPGKDAPYQSTGYHPYAQHPSGFAPLSGSQKQGDVPQVPHPGAPHPGAPHPGAQHAPHPGAPHSGAPHANAPAPYYTAPPNPLPPAGAPQALPQIHSQRRLLASPLEASEDSQGSRPPPADAELQLASASAVEAARMQAQRTAESYAVLRKATASAVGVQASVVVGRTGQQNADISKGEYQGEGESLVAAGSGNREFGSTAQLGEGGNAGSGDGVDGEEDDEDTKSSRYKRRLALNRESAAVSRIRRRAYIKELEDRLARVEKEKHELIGQVQIMLSQNDKMSSQLTDCFRLVASLQKPPK